MRGAARVTAGAVVWVVASIAAAGSCAVAAPRALTGSDGAVLDRVTAEQLAAERVNRDFHDMFATAGREQRRLTCTERVGRGQRRCRVSWFLGDTSYGGIVRVWLRHCDVQVCPGSAYRIAMTDDYCVYARKRSRSACTKVYTSQVFLNARGRYRSAPARFGWGSNGGWRDVLWAGWGEQVARGTGTVVFAVIQSGGRYEYPSYPDATIRLSRIRRCGARLSYTRVDISVPGLPEVGGSTTIGCHGL